MLRQRQIEIAQCEAHAACQQAGTRRVQRFDFRQSIRTQCQNQTIARHFVARQQIFHVLRKFTAAQLPARDIDDERQHRQSALACAQVMLTDMGDLPELEITDQAGPGASTQQFVFVDASEARMLPVQAGTDRSEEHTSELQSLMRISYAVFCLKKKKK